MTVKAALGGVASDPGAETFEWLTAVHKDQPEEHTKSMRFSRVIVLFHLAVFVTAIASGQWVFVLIVNCHSFCGNWLSYFVGATQHCGLRSSVPDFRKNTRSIALDPVTEFLFWHMNWHIEHHMFAGVPCYNLNALHREIAHDMPAPRSLVGAWREMRATWRRQAADPTYEFDTRLPATARARSSGGGGAALYNEEAEAGASSSIGDLAPRGLRKKVA